MKDKISRDEFINNIIEMSTDYGGIDYWCEPYTAKNGSTRIKVTEESVKYYTISHQVIEKGIKLIISGAIEIDREIEKYIHYANAHHDLAELDSTCTDCIVQVGLFGELVYG
jgi:hypothetical protein